MRLGKGHSMLRLYFPPITLRQVNKWTKVIKKSSSISIPAKRYLESTLLDISDKLKNTAMLLDFS